MTNFTKTEIDRLGDRLATGIVLQSDIHMLDEYVQSFIEPYEEVVKGLYELGLQPTGRPAKTTLSIAEKLRRESIRLTQLQDIAGCRVVVPDILTQNGILDSLSSKFAGAKVMDRRSRPSSGYRAVHLVVKYFDKPIEIQVRTVFQQLWAELSEKLADTLGSEVKYGGGDELIRTLLTVLSTRVAEYEEVEPIAAEILRYNGPVDAALAPKIQRFFDLHAYTKNELSSMFKDAMVSLDEAVKKVLSEG